MSLGGKAGPTGAEGGMDAICNLQSAICNQQPASYQTPPVLSGRDWNIVTVPSFLQPVKEETYHAGRPFAEGGPSGARGALALGQ